MRSKSAKIREVNPDAKYGSVIITKLINRAMRDGKKSVAQKQVYAALAELEKQTKLKAPEALDEVLGNISPQIEVRTRRVGGASYQVPTPVKDRRAHSLSIRWLIAEANKRSSREFHTFAEKLLAEMLDALDNRGGSIEKKLTAHRMADSNKAFAHFKW